MTEFLPGQTEGGLAGLLERIADAIEALAGRVEIGAEPVDRYYLGHLVGEIRAYAADVAVDPVRIDSSETSA